jgi:hypothetical protein
MMLDTERRIIFLGSQKRLFKNPVPRRIFICRDRFEVEAAMSSPTNKATWISFTRDFTDILLKNAVDSRADLRGSHLITLTPPRPESVPALLGLFHPAFGLVAGFHWLPKDEFVETIVMADATDRFIGGSVDLKAKALTLLRGDITAVVAPFSIFPQSGDGTAPDFTRLKLIDYGRTIALGDYEASADAILYELDPGYRRKLRKHRQQSEKTLGASLMRLRKQRGLKRSDFAPISLKEIARLERNEVGKPHAKTLAILASRLDVRPEEIESF